MRMKCSQFAPAQYPEVSFKNLRQDPFARCLSAAAKKIAVIFASGEINMGRSGGQSLFGGDVLGADTLAEQLRQARNNYAVKAVVLRVDSPGGSAVASDVILREAELLARKKPLVISMSDMAASGGYWISHVGPKNIRPARNHHRLDRGHFGQIRLKGPV